MNKTGAIIFEEFKQNMANLINDSSLPPFVIELVLKDFYQEIHNIAKQVYEQDKAQYANSLLQNIQVEED